jgi:hypothetical protein
MNNNELDNLVESFLTPKKSKIMELKELFALFDELKLTEVVQPVPIIPSVQTKGYEQEDPTISFFYKVYNDVLATNVSPGNNPMEKIQNFIKFVDKLKVTQGNEEQNLSNSLATILFTTSLHKMIEDFVPDVPSSAGFFFEKFINLLFKSGTVSTQDPDNPFPIQDIEVEVNGERYYLSLKLVKSKSISGSIGNILKFFDNKYNKLYKAGNHQFSLINFDEKGEPTFLDSSLDKKIIYIVANKTFKGENKATITSIVFNMYEFSFKEFLEMLGKEKALKYNSYLKNDAYYDDLLRQVKDKIKAIEDEIEKEENPNLVNNQEEQEEEQNEEPIDPEDVALRNVQKAATARSTEKLNALYAKRSELDREFRKLSLENTGTGLSANALKFNFPAEMLKANSTSIEGLVLSMRADERDTIVNTNKTVFDEKIKIILEEAGLINYKVNNYFLSLKNEKVSQKHKDSLAYAAYNSARKLENSLGAKIYSKP